jgi:hypothetical protein
MLDDRKISFQIAGNEGNDTKFSTKQRVNFLYIQGGELATTIPTKQSYSQAIKNANSFILLNSVEDSTYNVEPQVGLIGLTNAVGGAQYSYYKREVIDETTSPVTVGPLMPVKVATTAMYFVDYNISNGRKYQYVVYPSATSAELGEQWANATIPLDRPSIPVFWDCWSLSELIPVDISNQDIPSIKKEYSIDYKNIWLFKYNLEGAEQTQNITKSAIQTLGQYDRISHGRKNAISSSVSCLLGSEIIPYTGQGYVERLRFGQKLTSNERADMLYAWRKMVYSKNPKLLKDRKGQSWIVQILNGSNTPKENIGKIPDTITFAWTEVASLDGVIVTGEQPDTDSKTCNI